MSLDEILKDNFNRSEDRQLIIEMLTYYTPIWLSHLSRKNMIAKLKPSETSLIANLIVISNITDEEIKLEENSDIFSTIYEKSSWAKLGMQRVIYIFIGIL